MLRLLLASISLCFIACDVHGDDQLTQVPLSPKAGTYEIDSYRYVLATIVTNDGRTATVGSLYRDDLPVAGDINYRLDLAVGSFIWFPVKAGGHSFGWTRIDPTKKQETWNKASIEAQPDRRAGLWRTVMLNPLPRDDRLRQTPPTQTGGQGPSRSQ